MATKPVVVSEQTHARLAAWKYANGNADFDYVIIKALDALAESPRGLGRPDTEPATPQEPKR